MFKMSPNSKFLSTPLHELQLRNRMNDITAEDIAKGVPVIAWLVNNVGEIEYYQPLSWPSGNGWVIADVWDKQFIPKDPRVIIQKEVDDILLTEFVLRFA